MSDGEKYPVWLNHNDAEETLRVLRDLRDHMHPDCDEADDVNRLIGAFKAALCGGESGGAFDEDPAPGMEYYAVTEWVECQRTAVFEAKDEDDADRRYDAAHGGVALCVNLWEAMESVEREVERWDKSEGGARLNERDHALPPGVARLRVAPRVNRAVDTVDEG